MPEGGARGQNLEHLIICFCFSFSFMDSFVFRHYVLFRVESLSLSLSLSLSVFGPQGTLPQGGARGQNLGHLFFLM